MRQPQFDMTAFKERRQKLGQLIKGDALIVAAHPESVRNNDVHHAYRQDSNLFYLTGFEEPESVLVFRPGHQPETVLFVREKNEERETWEGFRYGPEGAKEFFGADEAYVIEEFQERVPKLLSDVDKVYYSLFSNHEFDDQFKQALLSVKRMRSRSGRGILTISDCYSLLGEMRVRKSESEVATMKKACDISAQAHIDVMRAIKPGVNERALYGTFLQSIMQGGCAREGYGGIFASGNNATTLHYVFNDQVCQDGDLFLIDAGGEFDYYSADITRTYPVNGKFSETQKRVYEKVLSLQKHLITMVKPGMTKKSLQDETIRGLVDIMIEEKVLSGSPTQLIENLEYKRYYPHNVGHWLGLDVHDAGLSEVNGEARAFEPGFVLTIEPGIYIPADDDKVPEELRGLGIRIEDDILVTAEGHVNLTASAPKEVAELEAIIGQAKS